MNYDVIIPLTKKNLDTIKYTISYIKKNLKHRNIILIGSASIEQECSMKDCKFLDENKVFENVNYSVIEKLIISKNMYAKRRTGWYFQQFIKMSYSMVCEDDYYIVWDADTIPLRSINMFDENSVPYFDVKEEYHKPYFTVLNKLFDGEIKRYDVQKSFISEHMLINVQYMKNLIADIERNSKLEGHYYFEKIINSIYPFDLLKSGFSEFETYGNYVLHTYEDAYRIRHLKSLRNGSKYLGTCPAPEKLEWAAKSYDIISFEKYIDYEGMVSEDIMSSQSLEDFVENDMRRS